MAHFRTATVRVLAITVICAGCGGGGDDYVDFRHTAVETSGSNEDHFPAESLTESREGSAGLDSKAPVAQHVLNANNNIDGSESSAINAATAGSDSALDTDSSSAAPGSKDVAASRETANANDNRQDTRTIGSDADPARIRAGEKPGAEVSEGQPSEGIDDSLIASITMRIKAEDGSARVISGLSGLQGPADNPVVENSSTAEPRRIELMVPDPRFRKERGTTAIRVTYDDIDLLRVLNMDPVPANAVEFFPEWLKAIDGKRIRIRGFMYPTFEATGLTSFVLARDNGICCFVRQPKIYDIIGVKLANGETSDYIENRPFDVEGDFHIDPKADGDDLSRLYRIDNARVLR